MADPKKIEGADMSTSLSPPPKTARFEDAPKSSRPDVRIENTGNPVVFKRLVLQEEGKPPTYLTMVKGVNVVPGSILEMLEEPGYENEKRDFERYRKARVFRAPRADD